MPVHRKQGSWLLQKSWRCSFGTNVPNCELGTAINPPCLRVVSVSFRLRYWQSQERLVIRDKFLLFSPLSNELYERFIITHAGYELKL